LKKRGRNGKNKKEIKKENKSTTKAATTLCIKIANIGHICF